MARREFRNRKNRSMLIGLYSLVGFSLFFLVLFLIVLIGHIGWNLSFENFYRFLLNSLATFEKVMLAMTCALPICFATNYLYISRSHAQLNPYLKKFLYWLLQTPVLLVAVGILYLIESTAMTLFVGLVFIASIKLSQRWIDVSSKIKLFEIQGMQAMGLSRPVILYHLYIRRFFKNYICHFFSVLFYLIVIVTPFLFLPESEFGEVSYISLDFFKSIAEDQNKTASLALLFVLLHFARSVLDQLTGYHEVEFG